MASVDLGAFGHAYLRDVAPELQDRFVASAEHEAAHGRMVVHKALPAGTAYGAKLSTSFDLTVPEALHWAEDHAGDLIVQIGETTRDSIRSLIVQALATGGHPYVVSRQIQPLIGLHSRYSTAVYRYISGLQASGMDAGRVAELSGRYYDKLLTSRANTIARTEILGAENQGRYAVWQQAFSSGLFGAQEPDKMWLAAPDAEEVCAGMDGQQVALSDEFDGGEYGDTDMPPLHPNCRCTAVVVQPQTGAELGDVGDVAS